MHFLIFQYPQYVGILVSRIPDISVRKSGHFQIVTINLVILGLKGYKNDNLWQSSTQKDYKWVENMYKFFLILILLKSLQNAWFGHFFGWRLGYWTKIIFLQLCTGPFRINVIFNTSIKSYQKFFYRLILVTWYSVDKCSL